MAFHEAVIEVMTFTYADLPLQQLFIDKNRIESSFLYDGDAYSVKAVEILNECYSSGDGAYGIPTRKIPPNAQ